MSSSKRARFDSDEDILDSAIPETGGAVLHCFIFIFYFFIVCFISVQASPKKNKASLMSPRNSGKKIPSVVIVTPYAFVYFILLVLISYFYLVAQVNITKERARVDTHLLALTLMFSGESSHMFCFYHIILLFLW